MRNKTLLIIGLIVLILILSLIVIFSRTNSNPNQSPQQIPKSSIIPQPTDIKLIEDGTYGQEYLDQVVEHQGAQRILLDKSNKVGVFIDSLPYTGTNFSGAFDGPSGKVIIRLNSTNINAANLEFDEYLKSFGIEDRTWVSDHVILDIINQ